MAYNSYFANIVTRLVFLLASFMGLAYLLVNTSRFFTIFFLSMLAVIQVISLIYSKAYIILPWRLSQT